MRTRTELPLLREVEERGRGEEVHFKIHWIEWLRSPSPRASLRGEGASEA